MLQSCAYSLAEPGQQSPSESDLLLPDWAHRLICDGQISVCPPVRTSQMDTWACRDVKVEQRPLSYDIMNSLARPSNPKFPDVPVISETESSGHRHVQHLLLVQMRCHTSMHPNIERIHTKKSTGCPSESMTASQPASAGFVEGTSGPNKHA